MGFIYSPMAANRRSNTSQKTRLRNVLDALQNHKLLYIPIAIFLIISTIATTLQPIYDLVQDVWPEKDSMLTRSIISDTLGAKPGPAIDYNKDTALSSIGLLPVPKSPTITVNLIPLRDVPFPAIRATLGNKSKTAYTIKALKIYTLNVLKSRELSEPRVLTTTTEWVVPLDTLKVYSLPATRHVELRPNLSTVIDLVFVFKAGDIFFKPSEIGQITIRLSFITDSEEEIVYPYDITF